MLSFQWINGGESLILRVHLQDSTTGQGKTNLLPSTSGLNISAILDNEATGKTYIGNTSIESCTPGSYAAPSANNCRFAEVDQTNHPGLYEIQLADERWSHTSAKFLAVSVSGASGLRHFSTLVQLSSAPADLRLIGGNELDEADLVLQSLTVSNPNGIAVNIESTGSDSPGLRIQGIGDAPGATLSGGDLGTENAALQLLGAGANAGITSIGGGDGGAGISVAGGPDGAGIFIAGGKSDGSRAAVTVVCNNATALSLLVFPNSENESPAVDVRSTGSGPGVAIRSGATGVAVDIHAGTTSGDAVVLSTTNGDGLAINSAGSGKVDVNATLPVPADLSTLVTNVGTPSGSSIATDIAAVKADTSEILADTGTTGVVVATGSKNGYALSSAYDLYHADIQFTRDEVHEQDEYTVTWFKNGVRIASGVSAAKIQVVKRADGLDLVAANTTMTEITSTGSYMYDEDEVEHRIVNGEAAIVIVTASIDDATRSFARVVGRDAA